MQYHSYSTHPDSVFQTPTGRTVQLKVHRCLWSGDYPENSLAALEECFRASVARAEIDIAMLRDSDFLVAHSGIDCGSGPVNIRATTRREAENYYLWRHGKPSSHRPPLFSEVVATIAAIPSATLLELDMKDVDPLPWPRVEELTQLVQPIKERVVFSGTDWNLRRLLKVDPTLRMGFNPALYLDWLPEGVRFNEHFQPPRGAYGYLDRHPLAFQKFTSVDDYLSDRLGGILRLVPNLQEVHLRLLAFERMLDDGVTEAANLFQREGVALDVWTLDVGTPNWQKRFARIVAAGVDIITTNTARAMAEAGRTLSKSI